MDVIVCTTWYRHFTDQCVYESDRFGSGSVMVKGLCWNWWSHLAQNYLRNIELHKIQRRYSWSYRSALSATVKLWSRDNATLQDVTWLVYVKTFWDRITFVFILDRHYHRICQQLNMYGMNSINVFTTVRIHQKHYRSCVMHLCLSGTTSHKPLSNDWMVLCVRDAKLLLLQEVVRHVTELCKPP